MSGDLAGWLLTQISEDEAVAREANGPHWQSGDGNVSEGGLYALDGDGGDEQTGWAIAWFELGDANVDEQGKRVLPGLSILRRRAHENSVHAARFDPSRVLAECAAKRAIIETLAPIAADDRFEPGTVFSPGDETEQAAFVLQMLAQPYSDRPGFRPEWQVTP